MKIKFYLCAFLAILTCSGYLLAQSGQWKQLHPENPPQKRYSFGMAKISENKLIVFGGHGGDRKLNDTWIYDFKKNMWEEIIVADPPAKRDNHQLAQLSNNKVLLFGGRGEYSIFQDTWIFDYENKKWTEIKTQETPNPRDHYCMTELAYNKIYMFSGNVYYPPPLHKGEDNWVFDLADTTWEKISVAYPDPSGREGGMMCKAAKNKLFLYGGSPGLLADDTWLLNYDSTKIWEDERYEWQRIEFDKELPRIMNGSMARIRENIVLYFGGFTNDGYFDQTLIFDINNLRWDTVKSVNSPEKRSDYSLVTIDENKVLLFAGINSNASIRYNDLWLFEGDVTDVAIKDNFDGKKTRNMVCSGNAKFNFEITNSSKVEITIYNSLGQLIKSEELGYFESGIHSVKIDLNGYPNGYYQVTLKPLSKIMIYHVIKID